MPSKRYWLALLRLSAFYVALAAFLQGIILWPVETLLFSAAMMCAAAIVALVYFGTRLEEKMRASVEGTTTVRSQQLESE